MTHKRYSQSCIKPTTKSNGKLDSKHGLFINKRRGKFSCIINVYIGKGEKPYSIPHCLVMSKYPQYPQIYFKLPFWLGILPTVLSILFIELNRRIDVELPIPFLWLFGVLVLAANFGGRRIGLFCAAITSAFLVYSATISFGPTSLTGDPFSVFFTSISFIIVAYVLGVTRDRNWALIRDLEHLVDMRTNELLEKNKTLLDEIEQHQYSKTELTKANQALQELNLLRDRLMSHLSHELRTPVTNIKLYATLLVRGKAEQQQRYLDVIEIQAERLQNLIERINLYLHIPSQLPNEKTDLNLISLNHLLTVALETITNQQNEGVAKLKLLPAEVDIKVLGVENLLQNALVQVLENAIRYSNTKEQIQVRRYEQDGFGCIDILDNGIGIEESELGLIFEPFYRGKQVNEFNIPGIGLGLAFADRVIALHGGKIKVESQVGEGSRFTLCLPSKSIENSDD